MATRSTAVTAAAAAAAALVATGITYASAASEPAQAAPVAQQVAAAPLGGSNNNDNGKGNEGGDHGDNNNYSYHDYGRIHINERDYSAAPGGCITVVSGLGARSLNVRNDSWKTVEVFNGATCDNGAPIATVGPHSSSNGLYPRHVRGGVKVKHGVVGSFRVVRDHWGHGGGNDNDNDHGGGYSGGK
ncbi:hypothetical protein AB0C59_11050 [Streptomyces sp. NPDC048664]|uniref:hypothetical protein n=1 Tax=Streptomyces sp. NPDC048664 TaxID=3154505 RepID=UPI003419852F